MSNEMLIPYALLLETEAQVDSAIPESYFLRSEQVESTYDEFKTNYAEDGSNDDLTDVNEGELLSNEETYYEDVDASEAMNDSNEMFLSAEEDFVEFQSDDNGDAVEEKEEEGEMFLQSEDNDITQDNANDEDFFLSQGDDQTEEQNPGDDVFDLPEGENEEDHDGFSLSDDGTDGGVTVSNDDSVIANYFIPDTATTHAAFLSNATKQISMLQDNPVPLIGGLGFLMVAFVVFVLKRSRRRSKANESLSDKEFYTPLV